MGLYIRLLAAYYFCLTVHANYISAGPPNTGDVRLVPNTGSTAREGGRLEVYLNDQWDAVCANGFGQNEGDVVCRQLGYRGVIGYGSVRDLGFNESLSSAPILLDGLHCCGDEERFVNCSHQRVGISQCSHGNVVAVICYGVSTSNPTNGTLRLNTDGISFPRIHSGRLEVYWNGEWGTVCDDGFGQMEANVACRELGYDSALFYDDVDRIGVSEASSDAPIWLSLLTCSPGDTRLTDCVTIFPLGMAERCSHFEDIALVCLGPGSIRLVNEFNTTYPTTASGRLEVYHHSVWGAVCADTFDQSDADIACRQNGDSRVYDFGPAGDLGYTSNPDAPIWLSGLQCFVNTTSFFICPSDSRLSVSGCGQQVALSCSRFFQRPMDDTALAVGVSLGTIAACIIFVLIIVSIPFCKMEWWCCLCQRYFKWRREYKRSVIRAREELESEIIIEPIPNYSREAQEPPALYSPPSQLIERLGVNSSTNQNLFDERDLAYADTPPPDPPKCTQALISEGPPTYIDTVTNL